MQAVLSYPEFLLAALFGLALFFQRGGKSSPVHFPQWLSRPAVALVLALPHSYTSWLQQIAVWAGFRNNYAFGVLCAAKCYASFVSLLLVFLLPLYAVLLLGVLVFVVPDAVVLILSKRRQQAIRTSLPQALDLMVLCVDAGLGLDATLQRIASEKTAISHVLNDELVMLGKDILLGISRDRAYLDLYNRTGVDELKTLGSALNQSGKLGLSISKILRSQSEFMRLKAGQKAEERAFKMPIYMAFPLWFCIMPALLLVVLGPSLINFLQQAGFGNNMLH
jgi:tight adherence protein C